MQALWSIFLGARKTIDVDADEKLQLSVQIVEQLSYFLSKPPSLWACPSVVGNRDEQYCRLAVPYSLFGTAMSIFEPGALPASFAISLLKVFVEFGRMENLHDPSAYQLWKDNLLQIVRYGFEHSSSDMAQTIRDGVLEENSSSQRQPPSMMMHSSGVDAEDRRSGVWAIVWECAVEVCRKAQMSWENIIPLTEGVPSGTKWADLEKSWGGMIKRTFELASLAQSSLALVASQLVPSISPKQFG